MRIRLQVIPEASNPGNPALGIGPDSNVLIHSFENRAAQPKLRINFMNGRSALDVQCRVIFRHGVLPVGLFAHLHITEAVIALFNVGNLGRRVLWSSVEHGDRNHCGEVVRKSAGEENVEAAVLVAAGGVHVGSRVPGINGRGAIGGWSLAENFLDLDKSAAGVYAASMDFLNGVSDAVADIF